MTTSAPSAKMLFCDPFIVLRSDPERRGENGLLEVPRRLFMAFYNRERDTAVLRQVDFDVVEALNPAASNALSKTLATAEW